MSTTTLEMRVASIVAMTCCLTVAMTYYLFTGLQSRPYVRMIFNVAIACFMGSTGTVLGEDAGSNSALCWYQGFVANYFTLASVFWIVIISYALYQALVTGSVIKDKIEYSYVAWGVPLVTSLLPLTTNTYSSTDGGVGVCFIGNRADSPSWSKTFWVIASFYAWVWIGVLLILFWFGSLLRTPDILRHVTATRTLRTLSIYPTILILCWSFTSFVRIWYIARGNFNYEGEGIIDGFANILPICEGVFSSFAFFIVNDEVKLLWYRLLFGQFLPVRESLAPVIVLNSDGRTSNVSDDGGKDGVRLSRLSRFAPPTICTASSPTMTPMRQSVPVITSVSGGTMSPMSAEQTAFVSSV